MMSMLNTHCSQIEANTRMAVTMTPDGRTFCLGKDFREVKQEEDERQYGIPRGLDIKQPAMQLALGKDHAIILTEDSTLYSLGSNQYGQLGIEYPDVEMSSNKKG